MESTLPLIHFTLYSRSYCHLCQDMLDSLHALQTLQRGACRFTVDVIDVDADQALVARFDELVPVLFGVLAAPELCHYFLDEAKVRQYIAEQQVIVSAPRLA
jgi:thiol-disulfide isomerase/thioredoxin